MTITALVVLTMALAAEKGGPVPEPATPAPAGSPTTPAGGRAGATCALRVVHVPPAFDSGILARLPRHFGDAIAGDDAIVRESLSSCAGVAGRRVSGSGTGER